MRVVGVDAAILSRRSTVGNGATATGATRLEAEREREEKRRKETKSGDGDRHKREGRENLLTDWAAHALVASPRGCIIEAVGGRVAGNSNAGINIGTGNAIARGSRRTGASKGGARLKESGRKGKRGRKARG